MRKVIPTLLLALVANSGLGESPQVYIFRSAKLRATEGLERQKSRDAFAREELRRYQWLLARRAASQEEYDIARAAADLAALDLRLAETRAKHASLSLDAAIALDQRGRRVPICKRKRQTDDNKSSALLKKLTARRPLPTLSLEQPNTGTKVQVQEPDPPRPPDPPPPVTPPEPPNPITPPKPPDPDPPDPPKPKPKPEKPKPTPPKSGSGAPK